MSQSHDRKGILERNSLVQSIVWNRSGEPKAERKRQHAGTRERGVEKDGEGTKKCGSGRDER